MPEYRIKNNIRVLRFQSGEMTQQELADRTKVTRQTINAIEAAKYSPSLELAFLIAKVFEKSIDEVFQYSGLVEISYKMPNDIAHNRRP